MDWESQIDGFLASVHRIREESREMSAEGKTISKRAELAFFAIHDDDIIRSSEEFFAALAVFRPIATQISIWEKSLSAASASLSASASSYSHVLAADPRFSAGVAAFADNARAVARSVDAALAEALPRFRERRIAPVEADLDRLDGLRSRALRLRYRVEQLERLYAERAVGALLARADPRWLGRAREALAAAKPAFVEAVAAFAGPFREWRDAAYGEFRALRAAVIGGAGALAYAGAPELPLLDFAAADTAIAAAASRQDGKTP
jgi:hypothetical protein